MADDDAFWNALSNGQDLIGSIPPDRWAVDELRHGRRSEPGRSVTFSAGVLSRVDEFDATFFGISPREARVLDPQQRLLLELAWEAMENGGLPPSSLAGSDCAVYVGISSLDYGTRGLDDLSSMSAHSMTGNTLSLAANRLSYVFDLRGPSLAVDTACSSSLVALHHACKSLQTGEAGVALVGGVNMLLHPYPFVGFTKASMLSADGRCKTFDARGNGYVRSEGGAVLILKPLEKALADGDEILAVILGTGVNADGARKTGITIPSAEGQAELMRGVLAKSGLNAHDVDFLEAHGTGTAVGDPVETAAIGAVYGQGRRTPLPVGSVKANLGHLESASGMAGLVKTMLALKKRALPPQIHLEKPNPHIDFQSLNIEPVTEFRTLRKEGGAPLTAGVNSFGFGGTNAHVLVQEHKGGGDRTRGAVPAKLPPLFLSARSEPALRALAGRYAALLDHDASDYYDIAFAAAFRRERMEKRLAMLPRTSAEASDWLLAYARGGSPTQVMVEEALPQTGPVAFVYSGNGSQWIGMGRNLLAQSPSFADILADLDSRMRPAAGFSLLCELRADEDASRLDDTVVAQPLLFAVQVALTMLLRARGVLPTAVTGHSVGEVAAAWAAGALDLDQAIRVIVARSRAQGSTRGKGRMAAVGLSGQAMQDIVRELGDGLDIEIAGFNSPGNCTLSGTFADLGRIQSRLEDRNVFFRMLGLDYAFHSRQMEPVRGCLLDSLAGLAPKQTADVAFVSTVTGDVLDGSRIDADYWWRNVREPVRFADAVSRLADLGCRVFLEIGPHAILQRYIGECLAAAQVRGRVLPTLRKDADGAERMVDVAMRVHLLADRPDLGACFPLPGRPVRLPNYPWQGERHWLPVTRESLRAIERRRVHPLLGWRLPDAEAAWENVIDADILPWLADHKVGGAVVLPGAAYAEMALAAAREWLGTDLPALEELDIVAPMVFDGEHARTLRLSLNTCDGGFQIKSVQRLSSDAWTLHAVGRVLESGARPRPPRIEPVPNADESIEREAHYQLASSLGLDYGPAFRGLVRARVTADRLEATLAPADAPPAEDAYLIHPAVLDICYQSLIDFSRAEIEDGLGVALLPVKVERLDLFSKAAPSGFRARLRRRGARSVVADFELLDASGLLVAAMSGCRFRLAPLMRGKLSRPSAWRVAPWLCPHPADRHALELPPSDELAGLLRAALAEAEAQRRAWFTEALPLLEALVLSFAYQACGVLAQRGKPFAEPASPFGRWLTGLLRREGLLVEAGGSWSPAESDLPAAADIWNTLLRDHPACLPQLTLLGRIGLALPDILSGKIDGRELSASLRTSAAQETPHDDPACSGTLLAVEGLLRRIAAGLPPHRRLRVLEISSGPSELPRSLAAVLPEDRLDYALALPDEAAVERQRAGYGDLPGVVVAGLSEAEWTLVTDRPLPEAFDVVILRHVLRRAPLAQVLLARAGDWLASGGQLLVVERHPDWSADFVAGVDPDWWRDEYVESSGATVPRSPLMPPAVWEGVLRQEGFDGVGRFTEPAAADLAAGAYVLFGRRAVRGAMDLPAPQASAWLLLADEASSALAESLRLRLESQGQRVVLEDRVRAELPPDMAHVVHLRGWNLSPERAAGLLADVTRDVRTLAAHGGRPPRLWFVTRGGALASGLLPGWTPSPAQSALWGFGRVLMNEHPELECTLIDLACDPGAREIPARLANELLRPDGAGEVVLGDPDRHTLVMREGRDAGLAGQEGADRFRLDFHMPGKLGNLRWLPVAERPLAEGEIEVRTMATGLNFRDVMYLMGLLPDEAVENGFAGASLGLEFSGVVSRTGPGVVEPRPGDRVMGFGPACFASHVVTRADAVAAMPREWSFEGAATVPTVFFTVYYALRHLADLQPGERVLIHGAAGGVGMAAIQLARHLGAEIFATAGNDEKRGFVSLLGADHVLDSRSLDFADDILEATRGEGVDVVLNSLAGEAVRRNLRVLKPFGRFLELGKRDFFENTPIGLRPFKDNISYFGIDADQLLNGRPQLAARMFREVMGLFRDGALSPLPCRVFDAGRVVDAFRVMQQARHIGKVVVSFAGARPPVQRAAAARRPVSLPRESTWLVTGGLSGFGLESARWLAARGVGSLVLLGRRGPETPGAREAIEELMARGVVVRAMACDITDARAVADVVGRIGADLPPLRGVLHAAMVIDDRLVAGLDRESIDAVLKAKLVGAWNLHQATLDIPLDHFVLYSSITTAIGNPGQANYVAANAALEGLAGMRRGMGLPAVAMGFGPIGDVGYLTRNTAVRDSLAQRLGKAPLTAARALDELGRILDEGRLPAGDHVAAVAEFDWNTLARLLPSATGSRFAILNRDRKDISLAEGDTDLRLLIAGKSPEEATAMVGALVIQEVAQILAIGADRIDPARSLHDLGLDSLMAVELAVALEQRCGVKLPAMMLNESPTAEKVARRIVDLLFGGESEAPSTGADDARLRDMAVRHGESLPDDVARQIVADAGLAGDK